MSHRQHLAHVAWLDLQWNEPDRGDWYLMQVAQKLLAEPKALDEMKVVFLLGDKQKPAEPDSPWGPKRLTKETLAAAQAKIDKAIFQFRIDQAKRAEEQLSKSQEAAKRARRPK